MAVEERCTTIPDGLSEPLRPSLLGPDDFLEGGAAGHADATGHAGWDGTAAFPDGAAGGYVNALAGGLLLGGGGNVLPVHPNSRGGRGGDMRVRSGRGGSGFARCDGAALPGGNGGDAGRLSARGGKGGDAPGGQGGDAGNVLHAEEGPPGQGGAGTPPGECGALAATDDVHSGESGRGVSMGLLGSVVEVLSNGCDAEPASCTTTPTTPPVTTTTLPCTQPRSYQYRAFGRYVGPPRGGIVSTSFEGTEVERCDHTGCVNMVTRRRVDSVLNAQTGEIRESVSEFSGEGPPGLNDPFHLLTDHCSSSGELLLVEGYTETRVGILTGEPWEWTSSCSGCRCFFFDQRLPRGCCPDSRCEVNTSLPCFVPYHDDSTCAAHR